MQIKINYFISVYRYRFMNAPHGNALNSSLTLHQILPFELYHLPNLRFDIELFNCCVILILKVIISCAGKHEEVLPILAHEGSWFVARLDHVLKTGPF